jgi:hypothetical protein
MSLIEQAKGAGVYVEYSLGPLLAFDRVKGSWEHSRAIVEKAVVLEEHGLQPHLRNVYDIGRCSYAKALNQLREQHFIEKNH